MKKTGKYPNRMILDHTGIDNTTWDAIKRKASEDGYTLTGLIMELLRMYHRGEIRKVEREG